MDREAERKLWHYATDCVTKGRLDILAEAPDLELIMVCQAVNYGLSYTHHTDRKRSGYITPQQARAVLKTRGSAEPNDPPILPTDFYEPRVCKPDGSGRRSSARSSRLMQRNSPAPR